MSMARLTGGPVDGQEVEVGDRDAVWAYVPLNAEGDRAQPGEAVGGMAVYRREDGTGTYTFERTSERATA